MRLRWLAVVGAWSLGGCAEVADSFAVRLPDVAVDAVELPVAPSADALTGYTCAENFGQRACTYAGFHVPAREELQFGVDLVLAVDNLDDTERLALSELFLTFSPFDPYYLGAACLSLCDPADPGCAPAVDAEGACTTDTPDDQLTPADVEPTLEGLLGWAADAPDDNHTRRQVPADRSSEVRVRLDLGIDPMLEASFDTATEAMFTEWEGGAASAIRIPYVVEGSATFRTEDGATARVAVPRARGEWVLEVEATSAE